MKKRTLVLLLTLALCLTLLPTVAWAKEPEEPQITWLTLEKGEAPWHYVPETSWLILGDSDGIDGLYHPAIDLKTGERLPYDYVDYKISDVLICVGNEANYQFKYGYINPSGEVVIPLEYDEARTFSEGLAAVRKDEKWGFVDTTGALRAPCQYEDVGDFSDGLARIETGPYATENSVGFIDKTGKVVIPCIYYEAYGFFDGVAVVFSGDECSLIDKTGKDIVSLSQYTNDIIFHNGLAIVERDGKCGFIDVTGKEVIPVKYCNVLGFFEGLAAAQLEWEGKWGFIDKTGKEVLPFQYDDAWPFYNGLALVSLNDQWGFIDKTGKMVVSFHDVHLLPDFDQGLILFQDPKDWKCGFFDTTGEEVIPLEYDDAKFLGGSMFAVQQGDQWGIFSYTTPTSRATDPKTASPTNDSLTVDGTAAAPTAYKIDGSNYFKLRDVAALLNGSVKQFDAGYDSATQSVIITTGKSYAKLDTDLQPTPEGQKTATPTNNAVYIDGVKVDLTVYKINDNNYFKLRDLGQSLDFYVGWQSGRGMFIETDKSYDPAS